MGVRFRCQIMSLFLFFSIYYSYFFFSSFFLSLSYSFVRLLMVKCLLRQVVTWSSLPGPILSSLSKPYNCACSHTFIHIRGLLLFQQQHTRVQIKQYICVCTSKIDHWIHIYIYKVYIHGVYLSACSYQ
jgi:hypothetical protein